jgi:hypothetical protein
MQQMQPNRGRWQATRIDRAGMGSRHELASGIASQQWEQGDQGVFRHRRFSHA